MLVAFNDISNGVTSGCSNFQKKIIFYFSGDKFASEDIPSANLPFIFDRPILCNTVKNTA